MFFVGYENEGEREIKRSQNEFNTEGLLHLIKNKTIKIEEEKIKKT